MIEKNPIHEKVKAYVEKHYKKFYNDSLIVKEVGNVFCILNRPTGSPLILSKGIMDHMD